MPLLKARKVRKIAEAARLRRCNSFTADTPVMMADGSQNGAIMVKFGRRRAEPQDVESHLRKFLGKPFSTLEEPLPDGAVIRLHGFAEVPSDGQVTMVTDGLASLARQQCWARRDGYAQELLFVLDGQFVGPDMLDFVMSCAVRYAQQGRLLSWDEPVRLDVDVPSSSGMRFLLPTPAAVFEEDFQFAISPAGETNFCLLVPAYEVEADLLASRGPEHLFDVLEEQDVDISDVRRSALRIRGHGLT
ncbi:suppressor of fused domain protein [Micromonospora zamorensis]|uniref:suppressor of fused domain protein n=1 Tax=Micromonospora zamorensis TaxID=709883 RepID=UPI0033A3EEBF